MPLKVDSIIASSIEAQTITQNGQSVGGDGWLTEVITLTSEDILKLNDSKTSFELLPIPGENKYYTWYGVAEFFPGLTPYTVADGSSFDISMDKTSYSIDGSILTQTETVINPFSMFLDGIGYFTTNNEVTLSYSGVSAITNGDGTLKIKISYKINEI